ncbi:uncharacterized protein LOC114970804 [Acropora millepora]|uniref:uncharacterized protein LOC114970804 n=1 Tax=Acropora millepora TaxID=45264 RepID=UPI001CF1CA15|nr:uncharacterized protein LOC114970804 [Acropora millepora]
MKYLGISKELSAVEFQRMKDLAKERSSDLNLQEMTDPYPFLSELERVRKRSCIVELLENIQRHDLVEKLGVSFDAGTSDHSLSGERDSSGDWDSRLNQNVLGSGLSLSLNLQCSNDESTCLDVHVGNPPGYSMDHTQRKAVEANDNSSVTAKCSPSQFEQEIRTAAPWCL